MGSSLVTNGTWSPLVTPKSFHCNPHASHSGLQWLLGITCGDQFPLVTCEDYTNETFIVLSNLFLLIWQTDDASVKSNICARNSTINVRVGFTVVVFATVRRSL